MEATKQAAAVEMNLRSSSSSAAFPQRTMYLDGIEGGLMVEFCKKFNCTVLIVEGEIRKELSPLLSTIE